MAGRVRRGDRLERAGSDRERQVGDPAAALPDALQDLVGEMQPGRRRGDGERLAREHGLVGLAVFRAVRSARLAPDVGGQGNASDPGEELLVERPLEEDLAFPVIADAVHDRRKALRESDSKSGLRPAPGPGQRQPHSAGVERPQEKDLDQAVLRVPAEEARRPDSHVVSNEDVAGSEKVRQVGKGAVLDRPGPPVEDEQAARPPLAGLLRDSAGRQVVVEEIDAHGA